MLNSNLISVIFKYSKQLMLVVCCALILGFAWLRVSLVAIPSAEAVTLDKLPFVVAEFIPDGTGEQIQGKVQQDIGSVKRNLGKVTGQVEGAIDQAQGKVQQDVGSVKRNLGKVTGQVEGAIDQTKGKAQQDIGEVKSRLDNAGDDLEDASDNMFDAFKSLFQ